MEEVIVVDQFDNEVGTMEKMEAHQKGVLHRAFSVLLFNSAGEILLQKRSVEKYHSGGMWTNTCCSHPLPGEEVEAAARRRLREEMGVDLQPTFSYSFVYKVELDGGLIEHELDHVFFGSFDGTPEINVNEVSEWKYVSLSDLKSDMLKHPDDYTHWFKLIVGNPKIDSVIESS